MRNKITKLVSLPYSIIGCAILLALIISVAHLLREIFAKIWCPWRRKRKVHSVPLQGVDVETPSRPIKWTNLPQPNFNISKVLTLEETLSKSSGIDSPTSTEQRRNSVISHSEVEEFSTSDRIHPVPVTEETRSLNIVSNSNIRPPLPSNAKTSPPTVPRAGAPSLLYLILLLLHICGFIAIFHVLFDVQLVKSIESILSTALVLDPGSWFYDVGSPTWQIAGAYIAHVTVGKLIICALIYSIWPSFANFLSSSGKELNVTTPVMVRS